MPPIMESPFLLKSDVTNPLFSVRRCIESAPLVTRPPTPAYKPLLDPRYRRSPLITDISATGRKDSGVGWSHRHHLLAGSAFGPQLVFFARPRICATSHPRSHLVRQHQCDHRSRCECDQNPHRRSSGRLKVAWKLLGNGNKCFCSVLGFLIVQESGFGFFAVFDVFRVDTKTRPQPVRFPISIPSESS